MTFEWTDIEGLIVCTPRVFADARGYFFESFSLRELEAFAGRRLEFVQDNESRSVRGVVRGLHFQRAPHAQAKLVRCTAGCILDVAVDLRPDSPTFGRHFSIELSSENKRQLFIPAGFAHGFSVLSPEAVFQYKCSAYYCPEAEDGIYFADPALGIDWRIGPDEAIVSPKDAVRRPLSELKTLQ